MKPLINKLKQVFNPNESNSVITDNADCEKFVRVDPTTQPLHPVKPSKVAVLLYYISCLLCMIGVIMGVRYFFFWKHGRTEGNEIVLYLASGLLSASTLLFIIMNWMNVREHRRIVTYVSAKAEEMMGDVNSRQRFNKEYADLMPEGADGPNGVK